MGRSREGSHQEDPGLVGTFSDFRDWMWNLLASVCLAVIVAASVVAAAGFFFFWLDTEHSQQTRSPKSMLMAAGGP